MGYPVRQSKSYQRDKDRMGRGKYRNTPLLTGVTSLSQSLLGSKVMSDAKDLFSRGKKSKFARALESKRRNPITSAEQYGLMQSVASGRSTHGDISREVAREMIAKTPRRLRSQYMKELAKHRNPEEPIVPEVEDKSKEWHGRGNRYVTEVEENETYDTDVAELADLEELGIMTPNMGNRFTISFKRDRPKLCCDGEGHNLEVIGGDQELNVNQVGIEHDGKRMVPLGYIYYIVYETDKHHLEGSNGYPESYEHYFGEEYYKKMLAPDKFKNSDDWFLELMQMGYVEIAIEKGLLPMGVYNQTDSKILIVGGDYQVQDVGIRN
jgi:hypothetical protein